MAELKGQGSWTAGMTWAQYRAVAWLRWRMLLNASRRNNRPAEIAGRVVLACVLFAFAAGVLTGVATTTWLLLSHGRVDRLWLVFWGIFAVCQLLNLQLGQPGTTFNPTDLIRFPLGVRAYVAIRLFFNLLSPANVMAALMSLTVAAVVALRMPQLTFPAFGACTVFAATNVLFSRMVFAWVDRWLSTRRAREVFTFLVLFFILGTQYLNFTFNPGFNSSRHKSNPMTRERVQAAESLYARSEPLLRYLPPDLTSASLVAAKSASTAGYLADVAGCAAFGALFLFVFAVRTRTEFYGESLSDVATGRGVSESKTRLSPVPVTPQPSAGSSPPTLLAPATAGVLRKEWIYMRRNIGLLYGIVTPLFLVFMAALKFGHNAPAGWVVPIAIMYSLFGIAPLSYNSFGLEGTGAQLYFMAPVPLRQVFVAKNLLHFGTALLEIVVVLAVITYAAGPPRPLLLLDMLLWAVGSLLLNTALGNRRSITAPKKINPGRLAGKQASQTSALLAVLVLLGCGAFAAAVLLLTTFFDLPWLALPFFAALAATGMLVYRRGLASIEGFTLAHRDALFEELGKS